jgi:hypothetical protein
MPKLKLPRIADEARRELPPELRWDAAPPSAVVLLGRREFLKALVVLVAALAAPVTGVRRAYAKARGRFFTREERTTLEALCDRIIPPDVPPGRDPGAKELGAPAYIEGLLTAFAGRVPRIFAGGPFSDRNPFPNNRTGTPSRRRPKNAFRRFIPLTRVQEIRWRAEIFGSDKVPGADFNDAVLGRLTGLQEVYRNGLARVNQIAVAAANAPFASLSVEEQDQVLGLLGARGAFPPDPRRPPFLAVVIQHTLEGCFSAPEYGGNHRGRGWQMLGLEGDDQPLGYSLYSKAADGYNERPDHPMSTPNPDELVGGVVTPRPLGADAVAVQETIVVTTTAFENFDC